MTRMLPERPANSAPRSEQEVFRLIRDAQGSDDFSCLHSLGLARHLRKAYGEADFIVIGPQGVFCLETKGGQIRRKEGTWYIGWPGSQYTSNEGPFRQAQGTIHPLIDELAIRTSPDFKRRVMIGWGVVFPDVTFEQEDPEWSLDVVCDIRGKTDFIGYIERLARHTREREKLAGRTYHGRLSPADCERIVDCFRRDFYLVPRMGDLVVESQRELAELSEQQYSILRYALDPANLHVMCPGAAGTGKTLIGLEAARRFGRQGLSVLFLCFNRVLGDHLRREISPDDGNVEIWSLHQYMRHVIHEAGHGDRLREAHQSAVHMGLLFGETYPDLFETALLELADQDGLMEFDVLVIDEGQDILFSPTIDAVGLALRGGLSEGRWIILFDPDLQSELYGRMDKRVVDTLVGYHPVRLELHENFRNPEPIIDEMCAVTGVERPICRRQFHARAEYRHDGSDGEQGRKLRALLVELLRDGASPSSITVLSGRRREESCIEKFPPDIGKKIAFIEGGERAAVDGNCITACTVSAFKGMENDIIILTDLPVPLSGTKWDRSVVYVGMTRARTRLYAMVSDDYLETRFSAARNQQGVEHA